MSGGLKEVLDFMLEARVFHVATVEDGLPRVRPFGFVMEHEGKLAFVTGKFKDIYKQMQAEPHVEMSCCCGEDMLTLRLSGKARFVTTPELQQRAIDIMPVLGKMYEVGSDRFQVFVLDDAKAVFVTMAGERREVAL